MRLPKADLEGFISYCESHGWHWVNGLSCPTMSVYFRVLSMERTRGGPGMISLYDRNHERARNFTVGSKETQEWIDRYLSWKKIKDRVAKKIKEPV